MLFHTRRKRESFERSVLRPGRFELALNQMKFARPQRAKFPPRDLRDGIAQCHRGERAAGIWRVADGRISFGSKQAQTFRGGVHYAQNFPVFAECGITSHDRAEHLTESCCDSARLLSWSHPLWCDSCKTFWRNGRSKI